MSSSLVPLLVGALLVWNTFISYMNARIVGRMWSEREVHGPFIFLVIWSALIQSAIGFSMPLLLGEMLILKLFIHTTPVFDHAVTSLWYLAVIVPALGTGLIITIHSWIEMFREKSFTNIATTAYNTVAMAHNFYTASSGIGDAFSGIGDFFKSDDEDNSFGMILLALALVSLSIIGGSMITYGVFNHYRSRALPMPTPAAA